MEASYEEDQGPEGAVAPYIWMDTTACHLQNLYPSDGSFTKES